jgi:hypothetical protein
MTVKPMSLFCAEMVALGAAVVLVEVIGSGADEAREAAAQALSNICLLPEGQVHARQALLLATKILSRARTRVIQPILAVCSAFQFQHGVLAFKLQP